MYEVISNSALSKGVYTKMYVNEAVRYGMYDLAKLQMRVVRDKDWVSRLVQRAIEYAQQMNGRDGYLIETVAEFTRALHKPCIALGAAAVVRNYPLPWAYDVCIDKRVGRNSTITWGDRGYREYKRSVYTAGYTLVKRGVIRYFSYNNHDEYFSHLLAYASRKLEVDPEELGRLARAAIRFVKPLGIRGIHATIIYSYKLLMRGGMLSTARKLRLVETAIRHVPELIKRTTVYMGGKIVPANRLRAKLLGRITGVLVTEEEIRVYARW